MPKETVLDRKVNIQTEILDVPKIERLCGNLPLSKQFIDIGDCKLYCEVEGEGRPVVLLHGGPGATHHYFHPHFSQASNFAQVVYYDQRGCGLSEYKESNGYSLSQAVDDLEHLRKALNYDNWVVIGHSYGGLLAQTYTVRYPESVTGLILVGSSIPAPIQLNRTRQYDFISDAERDRIQEIQRHKELPAEQRIFNIYLNGDWKRQNFHRPTVEKIARKARYEWKHDTNFNSTMGSEMRKVDLRGAFQNCPIPTIIVEGKWDLSLNTDKPEKLHAIHPQSTLVIFENSGHNPFEDEPEKFFQILRKVVQDSQTVKKSDLYSWKEHLAYWENESKRSPEYIINTSGWGQRSNKVISTSYSIEWLEKIKTPRALLKLGLALYDFRRYEEALLVFKKRSEITIDDSEESSVSLIWQGHMLDLLGKREEAISIYMKVSDLDVKNSTSHSQYELTFSPGVYASERIKTPFKRIENLDPD